MANNTNEYRFLSSTRNATTAAITQIVMGVISFIERMVFNQCFIPDYLGFYSLFKNIISVLSVAELGLSVAIAYSLYAPLADDNYDEVRAIMAFLKKVYFAIGTAILVSGLAFSLFLQYFVKTEVSMSSVRLYFIIFLLSTVFEYYLSYKYILFNADQKEYVSTLVTNASWAVMYLIQIIVSITTHSFLFYSLCILFFYIIKCLIINLLANKMYPYLRAQKKTKISKESQKKILFNIKGLILSKLGGVAVNSTDSILISAIVGSSILGFYSNYQMITKGLLGFTSILPNAITASLGNMGATETENAVYDGYRYIDMSFFLIYGVLSVVLLNIINPIVGTFFGVSRCLPFSSALIICILFYLNNNKNLFNTYKSSLGLFWYDRFRPLISGAFNIVVSIILGKIIGFDGILLGTILTYVVIDLWVEPLIIFHKGFHSSSRKYIAFAMARLLLIIILMLATHWITSFLPETGIFSILSKAIISFIIAFLLLYILFHNNIYVKQSVKAVKRFIFKKEVL